MILKNKRVGRVIIYKHLTVKALLFFTWLMLMAIAGTVRASGSHDVRLMAEKAMAYGVAMKQQGERGPAASLLQQALQQSIAANDSSLRYQVMTQQGIMHREDQQFELARPVLEEALSYFETVHDAQQTLIVQYELGRLWYEMGRNATALHYFMMASQAPEPKEPFMQAGINRSIGQTYHRLGQLFHYINPDKASAYFEEAYRYNREALEAYQLNGDLYNSCLCRVNMLEAALSLDKHLLADSILQQSAPCIDMPDYHIMLTLLMGRATLAEREGHMEEAARILQQVTTFKHRYLAPAYYHDAYLALAILARKSHLNDSAYHAATYAADWFESRQNQLSAHRAHHHLALWYEQDGMNTFALHHQKEATRIKNALIAEADTETFDELQYKYETGLLQTRLDGAEQQQRLQQRRIILLLMLFALTAATLTMGLVLLTMRRRKSQLMHHIAEEKAARLEEQYKVKHAELEKARMEKDLLEKTARTHQLEAEIKDQELLMNALRQTQVATARQDVIERFAPFMSRLQRKKDREDYEALLNTFDSNSKDDPLSHFEIVFKQAYGNMYARLAERCPELTRTEMQMAAMLRLNLTSKEIAHVMNLSIASIDKTRHQLRQKLKLDPGQNLGSYLMQL